MILGRYDMVSELDKGISNKVDSWIISYSVSVEKFILDSW